MKNKGIEKAVQATILTMIRRGELYTPEQAKGLAMANLELQTKMMTVAVNRGCGIGKKRFQRDVKPVLEALLDQWQRDTDTVDMEYADARIDKLYAEVMD